MDRINAERICGMDDRETSVKHHILSVIIFYSYGVDKVLLFKWESYIFVKKSGKNKNC